MAIVHMGSRQNIQIIACNEEIKNEYIQNIDLSTLESLHSKKDEDYVILEARPKLLLKIPAQLEINGMAARLLNIQQGTIVSGYYSLSVNLISKYVSKLADIRDYDQIVVNAIFIDGYFDKILNVTYEFDGITIPEKYIDKDLIDLSMFNVDHDQLIDFDFKITKLDS